MSGSRFEITGRLFIALTGVDGRNYYTGNFSNVNRLKYLRSPMAGW